MRVPVTRRSRDWTRAAALNEIVRGRLTVEGPIAAATLAAAIGVAEPDVDAALLALEGDGVVLRGSFTPSDGPRASRRLEWCDRALLARIHRYTLNRLRAEIEPVTPADFMRFLFKWHHVDATARLTGLDGLREVIALLDGFELPAGGVGACGAASAAGPLRPVDARHAVPGRRGRMGAAVRHRKC